MRLHDPFFALYKIAILSLILISSAISQNKAYKSAEVYGKAPYHIQYGKIEVRMKAAQGSGLLSTFFTWKEGSEQSAVFWEEIDVEVFGKNNATAWQSNIITGYDPRKTSEQVHNQNFSLGDDFHTYCIEWTPDYVSWGLDGQEIRKTTGNPAVELTSPAGIRFNFWASTSPSWAGSWDDTILPQYQFINWIKYYRYEDGEFIPDWMDEFNNFNEELWGKANWTFEENRADFEPQNAVVQNGMLILCFTKSGETGFNGTIPQDSTDSNTAIFKNRNPSGTFILQQNYPNPFNPLTTISYFLETNSKVQLEVFGLNGQLINILIDRNQFAGNHSIKFDATGLTSGIYLYKLKTENSVQTRKMVFIK